MWYITKASDNIYFICDDARSRQITYSVDVDETEFHTVGLNFFFRKFKDSPLSPGAYRQFNDLKIQDKISTKINSRTYTYLND